MSARVVMNPAGLAAYLASPSTRVFMERVGEEIANDASQAAPRRTGAMADSIAYEIEQTDKGPVVKVSWDSDHWYGIFSEVGTSQQPSRPFLRPAALKRRHL